MLGITAIRVVTHLKAECAQGETDLFPQDAEEASFVRDTHYFGPWGFDPIASVLGSGGIRSCKRPCLRSEQK